MNDARVDTPTPGSSSVEAYEEDWYRSLRALAERRRTELGQFDDQPEPESAEEGSPSTGSSEDDRSAQAQRGEDAERVTAAATPPAPVFDIWAARALAEAAKRAADAAAGARASETAQTEAAAAEAPRGESDVLGAAEATQTEPTEDAAREASVAAPAADVAEDVDAADAGRVQAVPELETIEPAGSAAVETVDAEEIETEPVDVVATDPIHVIEADIVDADVVETEPVAAVAPEPGPTGEHDEAPALESAEAPAAPGAASADAEAVSTEAASDQAAPADTDGEPTHPTNGNAVSVHEPDTDERPSSPWARVLRPLERIQRAPRPDQVAAAEATDESPSDVAAAPRAAEDDEVREPDAAPVVETSPNEKRDESAMAETGVAVVEPEPETAPASSDAPHAASDVDVAGLLPSPPDEVTRPDASATEAPSSPNAENEEEAVVDRPPIDRAAAWIDAEVSRPEAEPGIRPAAPADASIDGRTEVVAEPTAAETAEPEPEPEAETETVDPEPEPETETAEREPEAEADPEREREPEPAGPSLTSRDPGERRTALIELGQRDVTAAELETVAALILDPDAEIRRLAVETLTGTPARLDDAVVRQALQDPADEVRAAAVRAAATRGIRDLPMVAPLVDARRSPETHRTVLSLLPKILGEAALTAEALDPLLLAVAQLQPPPDDDERAALSEVGASIGTTLLIEALILPDARRLGAVRLLAGDRSHLVLRALAERAGDPLEEVRQAGLAAADEIERIEAEAARAAGPPDIGALAKDLRNPDPGHVERALATLSEVSRADVVAWSRERLGQGDAESVALVASVWAVLGLGEIGVELLTRGASLPPERRRPVIEALADFADASQLAGYLAVVPPDKRADAVRLVWEASGRRVLPDLRGLLADPAVEVRVAVIDIARDSDDPASIEAVAGLLATDASPEARGAAVRAIARSEASFPKIVAALGDPDPHVRATAVESMPGSPAADVGPVLAHALTDLDEGVRLAAIERLAGVSSNEPALAWSALRQCRVDERNELLAAFQRTNPAQVLEIALDHLYSPDQEERTLAVELTGWASSQAGVESAIRALGDPVPEVRRAAVAALERLRDRSAVQALGKTLADPDADVRVGALRALGVIDDEAVLAFLVAALKDPDDRVRETTSHVLAEWSSPAVAKRLAGVLAVPSLRDSAADLLRRIAPTSVELLIDVLIQGSPEIRFTVGPLLEQIVGIEEFLGRMDSLEPERRLRAIEALGAIAGPLAVDALIRALSDPDERIRLRATQLLGDVGDPIAGDAVRRLVDDPVPEVAEAARHALETSLGSRGPERPDYA